MFKDELKFEKYLTILPDYLRIPFTKFRVSNHKLPIEIGRHLGIERQFRVCHLCGVLGDEYHAIFECAYFQEKRDQFLDKSLHFRVNTLQYKKLFANENRIVELAKLAKLCKYIVKFYD